MHGNADAMSRLPATSSVLAISQWLLTDLSTIKEPQQANRILSSVIMALAQVHPFPSGIAPGLKHTFLKMD